MPTCTLACTRKRGLTHGSAPVCAQDHARTSAERDLSGGTAHNEAQGRRALVVLEICAADRAPSHKLQALVCGRDERAGVAQAQAGRHALWVHLGGRIPAAALLAEQAALLPVRHAPAAPSAPPPPRPAAPQPPVPAAVWTPFYSWSPPRKLFLQRHPSGYAQGPPCNGERAMTR